MQVSDTNYFSVQAWMVNKLNLRGCERDVFAIIYGYSQDEESDFHGSLEYLSQLTGYSRNAICTALKSLTDKELLIKTEKVVNNIKSCRYRTNNLYSVQATCMGVQATCTLNEKSVQATCMNNNIKDNKEYNKRDSQKSFLKHSSSSKDTSNKQIIDTVYNLYLELCPNLPQPRILNDKRKKLILNAYKQYGLDTIKECFKKANDSSFLQGRNDRGWKADFDFVLGNKFANILEGKYGSKNYSDRKKFGEDNGVFSIKSKSENNRREIEKENGKRMFF